MKGEDVEVPQVHSSWLHPHKCWKDVLLSWIVSLVLPLCGIPPDPEVNHPDRHIRHAQSMRTSMFKMIDDVLRKPNSPFRTWWKQWARRKENVDDWVRVSVSMQRNKALLQTWGIWLPQDTSSTLELPPDTVIHVLLTFPVSILPETVKQENLLRNENYGWLELQNDSILEKISRNVPIILYFHGGGMTLGHPNATEIVEILRRMDPSSNPSSKEHASTHTSSIILASVQYSLAPEHPFPAAPMDAISVVSTLLDQERTLHIAGVSAGGNLAIVSGLEALRAHPLANSHTRSIFIPFSMYQNSISSYVSSEFLRWCYRVYLELPTMQTDNESADCNDHATQASSSNLQDILSKSSNRKAWEQSKWKKSSLRRLAKPTVDLPPLDDWPGKIIVTTNAGDPLLCDGLSLVHALRKNGANVSHHAHMGSHWFGTMLDEKNLMALSAEWKEVIFA